MSITDLQSSFRRAEQRLGRGCADRAARRPRGDRGGVRLDPRLTEGIRTLLCGQERPRFRDLMDEIRALCAALGARCPGRSTVYGLMDRLPGSRHRVGELPPDVRAALHNQTDEAVVPGHQVAFYCLHHGTTRAVCFAAGLPWLDLHQAGLTRGWRPRTRGLLRAIKRVRGI